MLNSLYDKALEDKLHSKLLIRIKDIINKVLSIPISNISITTDLKRDFFCSDLEILQVIIEIEDYFNIEIDRDMEGYCSSVSMIIKMLLRRIGHI